MGATPACVDDPDDPRIAEFRDIRERDLTGRQGRFVAEGTVVLRMLVKAHGRGRFMAEKLLILRNRIEGLRPVLDELANEVPVYIAEAPVLDAIVGFHLHRGILAIGRRLEDGLEIIDDLPEQALVLVGCGISNHDNLGSIFRNAAAFGADAVLLDETSCDPLYRKCLRVSVGSVLSVPWRRRDNSLDLLSALAAKGFEIRALSPGGEGDLRDLVPQKRMALVVGTEGKGLPPTILARFETLRIPQMAGLDSLNVATATGIALYALSSAMQRI